MAEYYWSECRAIQWVDGISDLIYPFTKKKK